MDYAIIRVGNKQHRVRDGETLVVDRVHTDEGGTFTPEVLLGDDGVKVTVTVVAHERGPKILIGKYRRRTGYKRHNGFRAATSRIQVSLGDEKKAAPKKAAPRAEPVEAETPVAAEPEVAEAVEAPVAVEAAETPAVAEPEALSTGLPDGYEKMTVAAIAVAAKSWSRAELDAALAYEQEHATRKGALAALESALAASEEEG